MYCERKIADDFKITSDAKPSDLIKMYLGENYINQQNNDCLTCFDICCGQVNEPFYFCDKLYDETHQNFLEVRNSTIIK